MCAGAPPTGIEGFNSDLVGPDGYRMPATQHDAVLWLSGSAYEVVFDIPRAAIATLAAIGSMASKTSSWSYRHDRDLTGFIDGTENPTLIDAPGIALIEDGSPAAGGTILLLQKWSHDVTAWGSLPVASQERAIGRTKEESIEFDDRPSESHVTRTDEDSSARSSAATRRTAPLPTTARCSSGAAANSGRSPRCSRACWG